MALSLASLPYWCDQPGDIDPTECVYPLRAGALETGRTTAFDDAECALVQRIQTGDASAFEQLYRTHADGLIGFAARLCGSRAMAQDVVADLFAHLWGRRAQWQPRSGIRAYLFAAVRHRVLDALRTERRADTRAARVASDPSLTTMSLSAPDAQSERDERLTAVWHMIDTFPVLRRQVMYLRWARELTPEEIAVVLGVSRNAVDKHLSRAAAAIREALG